MKTKENIKMKIKEHEDHINVLLNADRTDWTDIDVECIESYLKGRRALQWVLSNDEFANPNFK